MTFLWALNFVIAKFAVREIPAIVTAGLRTALAGLMIAPIYYWERRAKRGTSWNMADVPMLLLLGMFGVALNQVFFVIGIGGTSVAHAAILIGMTPILVLLIASAIGQESIRIVKLVGMAIALGGVVALQLAPSKGAGTSLRGDFFILLASITFAVFTVMGKRVAANFDSITVNTFAYVGGGVMLLPVTMWQSSGFAFGRVSWIAWASLVYMAAFPSVLCYLIYYYALGHITASRVSAFSYLQPLLATGLAIPFLGETPTSSLILGGSLVLLGVFVAARVMAEFVDLLRSNRNYRYTWMGQVVSEIGDHFNNIAVFSLALKHTHSGMVISGIMLSRAVPAVMAGPLAGVLLDRMDRKRIMIISDLVRFAVALGFILTLSGANTWMLYPLSALLMLASPFFTSGRSAILPSIASKKEMHTANSLTQTTGWATLTVGTFLGGTSVAQFGYEWAFVLNAMSFLFSAFCISRLRVPAGGFKAKRSSLTENDVVRPWHDYMEGLRYMRANPLIFAIALVAVGWATGGGAAQILFSLLGNWYLIAVRPALEPSGRAPGSAC